MNLELENELLKAELQEKKEDIKAIHSNIYKVIENLELTNSINEGAEAVEEKIKSSLIPMLLSHFSPNPFKKNKSNSFKEKFAPMADIWPIIKKIDLQIKAENNAE
jgi:hypothetical protein